MQPRETQNVVRLEVWGRQEKCGLQEQDGQEEHLPCWRPGVPKVLGERDPVGAAEGTRESQARVELDQLSREHRRAWGREHEAKQSGSWCWSLWQRKVPGLMGLLGTFWSPYGPEEQMGACPSQSCWLWTAIRVYWELTLSLLLTSLQTAVDVFRRIILEAEKIDGAASQGKSSCSVMWRACCRAWVYSTWGSKLPVILEDKTRLLFSSVNLNDVIWVRGPPLSDYVNVWLCPNEFTSIFKF